MADGLLSDSDVGLGATPPPPSDTNAAPPAASAGPKLLSDADIGIKPTSEDTSPTFGSTLAQIPTGANEALADTLGAPVDMTTWLANKVLPDDYQIKHPFLGSDSIKTGMGAIKADPRNAPAKNAAERIARGVGAGIAGAVAPEAALGTLARAGEALPEAISGIKGASSLPEFKMAAAPAEAAPATVNTLGNTVKPTATERAGQTVKAAIGNSENKATVASTALAGGVGGGTGKTAAEIVPDDWKPYADMAGNIIGGGATGIATSVAREAPHVAADAARPFNAEGQKDLAAAKIKGAISGDKSDVMDALTNQPHENVPGSNPTTFQQTKDTGLGSLERAVETANPGDFADRRGQQNAARVNALSGIQETGAPEAVTSHLRDRLADIDKTTQSAIDDATGKAKQATADLGPGLDTAAHGQNISSAIAPQVESATRDAANQAERLGGQGTPEEHGTALRQSLADAETNARASERQLWQSVDPDRKLVVSTGPVTDTAKSTYGQLSPAAVIAMSPAEHNALSAINELGDASHLQDITDLRSSLSGDMRAELLARGRSPAYARLSKLRGSIDDAINGTINRTVDEDGAAAAAGKMPPQETMGAKLQREADAFRASRQQREAAETPEEAPEPTGIVPGGARQAPEEPLEANFSQEDKDRLDAATNATRERATTFGRGDVGTVLRKETGRPDFKMVSSAVPDKIFHSGNTGGQDVRGYLDATGNDPQAAAALHNYAAYSLRKAAMRPDGTLDPKRYTAWLKTNGEAVNALPPAVRENFANVARASESLNRFAPFKPDMAPSQVPELFFHPGASGGDGVRQFKSLVGEDNATKMLSDYAADTLVSKATRPDGTLDPAKLATWQKQHADALKELPGLSDRFSNAANATKAINDAAEARATALDNYQKGAVGKLLKVDEPEDVTRAVGKMFGATDSTAQFRQLAKEVDGNPAAKEGLRKSVVDHMLSKFLGNTEAGTSGTPLIKSDGFQKFVKDNRAALSTVFTPEEIGSMEAVVRDLKRSSLSTNAVRIPGGSNTAQDTAALAKHSGQQTILQKFMAPAIGGAIGHAARIIPFGETIGAIAGGAVNGVRDAGMKKVDDLVRQAMLNPDMAATLLKRAPVGADRGSYITLQQKLARISAFGGLQAAHEGEGQAGPAPPRRIPVTGGTVVGGPPQ